jgi:hypothetical protein
MTTRQPSKVLDERVHSLAEEYEPRDAIARVAKRDAAPLQFGEQRPEPPTLRSANPRLSAPKLAPGFPQPPRYCK